MRAQHSMVIRCLLRPQQRPAQLNMTPRPGTQSASGLRQARSAAAAGRVAWQQPDFARLRAAERGRVSVTKFPLRGVSFEERQSHLKQVAPGEPQQQITNEADVPLATPSKQPAGCLQATR